MYVYGFIPDDFVIGIAVPLVKMLDGNKLRAVSQNYRLSLLSQIISKLFEMALMKLFGTQLQSDSLQYSFQSNSSCS